MFNSPYGRVTPVTADYTATKDDDVLSVPSSVTAIKTLTLPLATQKDVIYVRNNTNYLMVVAAQSGNSIIGQSIVLPGQLARYDSDLEGIWWNFAAPHYRASIVTNLVASDITGMNAAPLTLVPAPGAGRVLIFEGSVVQLTRTSTAFASGGAVETRYTNGSGAKVSADLAAAFITGGAGVAYDSVAPVVTELTPVANAAIVMTNATGAFTGGTGATGKVRVTFRVADFN